MKNQGHAAEYGDDAQADPEHGVNFSAAQPNPADLPECRRDGNTGCNEDVTKLERRKKQDNGE